MVAEDIEYCWDDPERIHDRLAWTTGPATRRSSDVDPALWEPTP